ncbi:MAG: alpha/beta hydrolase [Hyphomicrobiaceae bacterium]
MPLKTADIDILIVPGWTNSGPEHWQTRWERKLANARRVEQADWDRPVCADWVARIVDAVRQAKRPVVLIAHSCGVSAVVHAAPKLLPDKVAGALLVAPPDYESAARWTEPGSDWLVRESGFHPVPTAPLPFPSMVIASRNDPFASYEMAQEMALDWGSDIVDAGQSGHLNTVSGHGPWPEGLLKLGQFLKRLG